MNTVAVLGIQQLRNVFTGVSSSSLESQEEIISRLKFIGHIEKDEKINVRHVNRQPNTIYTKIYRSFIFPDNRTNTLKFLKDVIGRTFDIIEIHLSKGHLHACTSLASDLLRAKNGMLNMKYTYADDTKFCCDIDVLIEFIVSRLQELNLMEKEEEKKEIKEDKKEE